jgi:hypothetical protein
MKKFGILTAALLISGTVGAFAQTGSGSGTGAGGATGGTGASSTSGRSSATSGAGMNSEAGMNGTSSGSSNADRPTEGAQAPGKDPLAGNRGPSGGKQE